MNGRVRVVRRIMIGTTSILLRHLVLPGVQNVETTERKAG